MIRNTNGSPRYSGGSKCVGTQKWSWVDYLDRITADKSTRKNHEWKPRQLEGWVTANWIQKVQDRVR